MKGPNTETTVMAHALEKLSGLKDEPIPDVAKALLAHDLRSAMADVLGGLQLIETTNLGVSNQRQIARIAASASMAMRLLDACATESIGGGAALSLSGQGVDLNEMLADLESRWRGRITAKKMDLIFHVDFAKGQTVACDRLEIERLLTNLLENAAKFADSGVIALTAYRAGDDAIFCLTDEGPGFCAGALEMLFSLGGRPDASKKPGTGFGLFIAHQIAKKMRGEIKGENTATGARLTVTLPIFAQPPVPFGLGVDHLSKARILADKKILLAEDNITNQVVASQMLQVLGAQVVIVDDGLKAWNILQEQTFDLALLDIEMPGKTGLEVIRDIRALETPVAKLPMIALTAYVLPDHRQRILENGADGIIAKPLMNIDEFGRTVLKLSRQKRGIPPSSDQTGATIDKQVFNSLRNAVGEDVFADLLSKLIVDLVDVEQRVRLADGVGDAAEIRSASHILISLSGAIGAMDLLALAKALNAAANQENISDMRGIVPGLLRGLVALIDFLRAALIHQKEG